MKLFFEDYNPEFELQSDVASKVYNALADIAFDLNKRGISGSELKKYFDYALEWFDLHFWDDEDLDEAINPKTGKYVDLTDKVHSIAYAIKEPENNGKFHKILDDLLMQKISLEEAKKLMIQLFSGFDNVSENQIRKAQGYISNIRNVDSFSSTMGTYELGDPVLNVGKKRF